MWCHRCWLLSSLHQTVNLSASISVVDSSQCTRKYCDYRLRFEINCFRLWCILYKIVDVIRRRGFLYTGTTGFTQKQQKLIHNTPTTWSFACNGRKKIDQLYPFLIFTKRMYIHQNIKTSVYAKFYLLQLMFLYFHKYLFSYRLRRYRIGWLSILLV